ncbi:MAG: DDE-type integrase/transposase/recombinase [Thermaerobacter sp.]|nr:DDE-type integrase/transposase/recombinase [Thermaerobacter sp.]
MALKREVPERSAEQVLALLAAWASTGLDPALVASLRRSTWYRHWHRAGMTRRRLRTAAPKRYRRWEAPEPGALWQSDVMNGPYLPDPTPEDPDRKRATDCLVLMDDYSRRIVAGRFAWSADSTLLEALLWEALQKWGAPERLYTDNGAIYTSDRLETILARLTVRLVHAPPYTFRKGETGAAVGPYPILVFAGITRPTRRIARRPQHLVWRLV